MLEWSFHGNLCRTIGPLLSQRFPLASAKAQPRGGFGFMNICDGSSLWDLNEKYVVFSQTQ